MVPEQPHNRFFTRIGVGVTDTLGPGLEAFAALIRQQAMYAVMEAGEHIRALAWGYANVSPGIVGNATDGSHMRDNINVTPFLTDNGAAARIGIDLSVVPYAHHQEFGPRGKPFMRPALDESRELVREIMAARLREVFDDANVKLFTRFYRGKP
jgi:HK97 gp10 family phage protein